MIISKQQMKLIEQSVRLNVNEIHKTDIKAAAELWDSFCSLKKMNRAKLSNNFHELRVSLGMMQSEFAQALGVSQSLVSKIESGFLDPDTIVLKRLHVNYGIDINAFLAEYVERRGE